MNFKNRLLIILIVFIFSLLIALPSSWKSKAFQTIGIDKNPVAQWFINKKVNLGLDLQGGTQLDYKVDLRDVPLKDQKSVMDGVVAVFERRVNSLGVSEPNIYQSSVGDEQHIIIELAGIKDINEAKKTIGKVIQLEFKEQNNAAESDQKEQIRLQASNTLREVVNAPEKFQTTGNEIAVKDRIEYKSESNFTDNIPDMFKQKLQTLGENQVAPELIEGSLPSSFELVNGEIRQTPEKKGFFLLKLDKKEKVLRLDPKNAEDFMNVANEVSQDSKKDLGYVRKDELPADIADTALALPTGNISDVLSSTKGYYIVKSVQTLPKDTTMVRAEHILLKFKDIQNTTPINTNGNLSPDEQKKIEEQNKAIEAANNAANTYNQTDLPKKANDLFAKIKADPAGFEALVKDHSDDTATKTKNGDLGYFGADTSAISQDIRDKALTLNVNDVAGPIKTKDGYELIKITDKKAAGEQQSHLQMIRICYAGISDCQSSLSKEDAKKKADETLKRVREETKYTYETIYFSTVPDPWKPALAMNPATKEQEPLTGKFFKHADVEYSSSSMEPIVSIKFDDIGAKMFEEITARLVNKPLAIFVGGDLISSPNVREKISGGSATITGNFTPEEAGNLARDLNAGAIPAPITLVGEQQVGAQLGNDALQASIKAGMWGVIVLMLFLIFFYRLPGLVAGIALGVYIIMFMAFIKLWPGMVLTLAGVAGAILSIGMAVDANVLIFERLKEELKAGKGLTAALKAGFDRAWTSIRDSNTSSLFTGAILLWFGSSIIRGFAFMLIVGIVLSLFSAIFTTRTFLQIFMGGHDVWKNLFWWGLNKKKEASPLPESTLEKK